MLKSGNLALRFLCELAALAGLAVWGTEAVDSVLGRVALGLGSALLAAVVWGLWVAPKSRHRLADPARWAVELVVFAAATVALIASGRVLWGIVLAVVSVATGIGVRVWGELEYDDAPDAEPDDQPSIRSTSP